MKAMVRDAYGGPEVFRLEEVPQPSPGRGELLVRVHAAALNKGDHEILVGSPLWVRLVGFGLFKPRQRILGSNFAGTVEAVGEGVGAYQPGDEIFGDLLESGLGAYAEYVCVPVGAAIFRKPAALSFEEAASLPESGFIAVQALRDKAKLGPGSRVLINGAGGGAGSFGIQLAKSLGAEVTAIDRGHKLDWMRSLGADRVVDFTREDVGAIEGPFDAILDVVGVGSMATWARLLRPGGTYLAGGGTVRQILKTLLHGAWLGRRSGKRIGVLGVRFDAAGLQASAELVASGVVRPTVEKVWPLAELADAMAHLGAGRSKGKLVVRIPGDAADGTPAQEAP